VLLPAAAAGGAAAALWQALAGRGGMAGLGAAAAAGAVAADVLLTCHPTLGFHAPVIVGAAPRAQRPRLALTFDDGPVEETAALAARLAERGVQATFFLIGARAEQQPGLVRRLVADGHEIGCHSYGHARSLSVWRQAAVAADLSRALAALQAAGAPRPRYYRAPAGVVSPPLARAVSAAGLELVAWTARALDGVGRPAPGRSLARLRGALADGAILVMHDRAAPPVIDALLGEVAAAGLEAVTLRQLLDPDGHQAIARMES
jgi:peptidoglycan/xylan/chitin deacetylase (PgdA/CDA1 family)